MAGVEGGGTSCEDIDPLACSSMAEQNANMCSEPALSQTVCPKFCGNCPLSCYSCNITNTDVSTCNIMTCDKNKKCLVEKMNPLSIGQIIYNLRCDATNICQTGMKNSMTINCCDSDLCNVPVASTSTAKISTITTTETTTITTVLTMQDPCSPSPCVFGTCTALVSGKFRCSCILGYTGPTCRIAPNPCTSNPCVFGTCSSNSVNFTCMCNNGYTGRTCDTALNPCYQNPCKYGTCHIKGNTFECRCHDGLIGKLCDRADVCSFSPCVNGICTTLRNASSFCTCKTGYTGALCDTPLDHCASNPCFHGTCLSTVNSYFCSCEQGWIGQTCKTLDPCRNYPCLHGVCTSLMNSSFYCTCKTGFTGVLCDTPLDHCTSNPCAHGTCSSQGHKFVCSCEQGWIGSTCNIPDICRPSPCLHGACMTLLNLTFHCTCQTGYTGALCDTPLDHCSSNPCIHGSCSSRVDSFNCSCDHGWKGSTCNSPDPCANSPCVNGFCYGFENGAYQCICNNAYTGKLCDIALNSCYDNPCFRGTCTPAGRHFICNCENGWTGATCNSMIDYCSSNQCVHGQCTSDLMSYQCSCSSGYVGKNCDKACKRDVIVKIDGTLLSTNNSTTVHFLQKLVDKMIIGSNGVLMGVSIFHETGVNFALGLGWQADKISLITAIGKLHQQSLSGIPDIYQPVHSLYNQATTSHVVRVNVPDVALIITSPFKSSKYISLVKSESDRVNMVMPIITIGVGNVNTQMLGVIAKDKSHSLSVRSVNDLVDNEFVVKVLNLLCL